MVGRVGASSPGHKGGIPKDLSPDPETTSREPSTMTAAGSPSQPQGLLASCPHSLGRPAPGGCSQSPCPGLAVSKGPCPHLHGTSAAMRGVVPQCCWPGPRKLNPAWVGTEGELGMPARTACPPPPAPPSVPGRGLLGGPCQHSFLLPSWNAEGVGEEEPENTHPPPSPSLGSHWPLPDRHHLLKEAVGRPTSPKPRGPVLALP